ncbi:MAG TPA: adenylyl-sulfate kinase [Rhodanobacteraceae bacterium]|nr:adenylyl-sulfate kinase [Rhodanobacteraceae bacterium]
MTVQTDRSGGVIWITGYSAAGKTTVGRGVMRLLHERGRNAIFLDGDQLRAILAHKWGYSNEERIELACTYFRLCSHLSKQGAIVVISAVAMFEPARRWFHQNIEHGLEVYLRVPLEERLARDRRTKGIYKDGTGMEGYTEPADADLVIDNFGRTDPDSAAEEVLAAFERHIERAADYGRDNYWAGFYRKHAAVTAPSPFAKYCLGKLEPAQRLLEIGCGNGRDAMFFAANGFGVTALDKSQAAIDAGMEHNESGIEYICCDVVDVAGRVAGKFGVVYSRFSLHAMTRAEEERAIAAAHDLLSSGGMFCIECRSINDPLARTGDVLSPDERIAGHYRRFIALPELLDKLRGQGFEILEQVESRGLAVFGDEDPVVIRVLARS